MSIPKVAIIGGGAGGLVSAKECLEAGLHPTIFEKKSAIGGVWNPDNGIVWDSMKANLSCFHMGFADFPWDNVEEDFPTGIKTAKYLEAYAKHYKLTELINYGLQVIECNYNEASKKWELLFQDKKLEEFDFVIFASGIFSKPFIPKLDSIKAFKGTVIHSKDYKAPTPFIDKQIAIIGGSFSGYEIAVDFAQSGIKVTHLIRRPAWIANRYYKKNETCIPLDIISYNHPSAAGKLLSEKERAINKINFLKAAFGNPGSVDTKLKVDEEDINSFVVISDSYLKFVEQKIIQPYVGSLSDLRPGGCILSNGNEITADAIIFCTGFLPDLPIQDLKIRKILRYDESDLFQPLILNKSTIHPDLTSAAFVGLYRGPFFGVMELQARWVSALFSNNVSYPTVDEYSAGLQNELLLREKQPRAQFPRGNYVEFMYELAKEINAEPLDLLAEANENPYVPMIPADFRRYGFNQKPEYAIKQRSLLLKRLENK